VLLLHFEKSHRAYHNNLELKKHLKKKCPDYEKDKDASIRCFKDFTPEQIRKASERLKARDKCLSFTNDTPLRERARKDHMSNSNFHVLIDVLTENKS
jgi:hypothetical protein